MIQKASDIGEDLRLINFGMIKVTDYAVRAYFRRIEYTELECDCIRQDLLQEAKMVTVYVSSGRMYEAREDNQHGGSPLKKLLSSYDRTPVDYA